MQEHPALETAKEQLRNRIQELLTEIGMAAYHAGASGYSFDDFNSHNEHPHFEVRFDDGTLLTTGIFVFNAPLADDAPDT